MIKFSGHPLVTLLGWLLIPSGVIILLQGVITYRKMRQAVEMERQKTEEAELIKR